MFINFGDMMGDMFDVTITIYLGNKPVQQQQMSAPQVILQAQFMSLVQQIAQEKQPMSVIMSRDEIIWDTFEQKQKVLPLSVEFTNFSYENMKTADAS